MFDPEQLAFTSNNSPSERLSGLSPIQFFELTHNSFLPNSPVKLRENIPQEIYDQIPFLRLVESFLSIVKRENGLKLTPTGRIPVKVLLELYSQKYILDELIEKGINKLSSEDYWPIIVAVKSVCKKAGVTRMEKNKIVLVKKNMAYLERENRESLFRAIYLNYTEEFNWAYFDGYPELPVGQYGVNFSIYLLLKYGDILRNDNFYSEKYFKAYPNFGDYFNDETYNVKDFHRCYSLRTFERFTNWFGFTITNVKSYKVEEVCSTQLLPKIFELDV
jgi:hypothetical protein